MNTDTLIGFEEIRQLLKKADIETLKNVSDFLELAGAEDPGKLYRKHPTERNNEQFRKPEHAQEKSHNTETLKQFVKQRSEHAQNKTKENSKGVER